jgi:hypothetical protein
MESEKNKDKDKNVKPTGSQPVQQEEATNTIEIQNVISSLP